jgi:anthranilate phosphoribosyltransferase
MSLLDALEVVQAGEYLSRELAAASIGEVLQPGFDEQNLGLLLTLMADRGESADEILGGAEAMRAAMTRFPVASEFAVDTCGTGGDGLGSFNISTASALVAAAAGAKVVKHGNRSVSSSCGSADLFEAAGVELQLSPAAAAEVFETCGIVFLYAPAYHPAMRHVAAVRARLKRRSLFNFLGPLCHPGRIGRQLLGIGTLPRLDDYALILKRLGCTHGYVVHGADGADELTLAGANEVRVVGDAPFASSAVPDLNGSTLGFPLASASELQGGDVGVNLQLLAQLLDGQEGAIRNAVILNTAATLLLAEVENEFARAAARAAEAIDSGAAKAKLAQLVETSQRLAGSSS